MRQTGHILRNGVAVLSCRRDKRFTRYLLLRIPEQSRRTHSFQSICKQLTHKRLSPFLWQPTMSQSVVSAVGPVGLSPISLSLTLLFTFSLHFFFSVAEPGSFTLHFSRLYKEVFFLLGF